MTSNAMYRNLHIASHVYHSHSNANTTEVLTATVMRCDVVCSGKRQMSNSLPQLVEELRYKPQGRTFEYRLGD